MGDEKAGRNRFPASGGVSGSESTWQPRRQQHWWLFGQKWQCSQKLGCK